MSLLDSHNWEDATGFFLENPMYDSDYDEYDEEFWEDLFDRMRNNQAVENDDDKTICLSHLFGEKCTNDECMQADWPTDSGAFVDFKQTCQVESQSQESSDSESS